jgi:hypothetical protein
MEMYSRRELIAAQEARDLRARLGFPSTDVLAKTLAAGAIIGVRSTPQDVIRDVKVNGQPAAYIRGKARRHAAVVHPDMRLPRVGSSVVVLHMDLAFWHSVCHLVAVSTPGDVSVTVPLGKGEGAKSQTSVAKGIKDILVVFARYGIRVSRAISDGERGISASAHSFAPVEFIALGAGDHDGVVERKIQTLESTARAMEQSAPFEVPPALSVYSFNHAAYCTNRVVTLASYQGVTPAQYLTGVKPDMKRDFPARIFQYAEVVERSPVINHASRTTPAIVVGMTGTGSVKFISLVTGKVVVRSQFHVLPWPQVYIDVINGWARNAGPAGPLNMPAIMGVTPEDERPSIMPSLADYDPEREVMSSTSPNETYRDDVMQEDSDDPEGPQRGEQVSEHEFSAASGVAVDDYADITQQETVADTSPSDATQHEPRSASRRAYTMTLEEAVAKRGEAAMLAAREEINRLHGVSGGTATWVGVPVEEAKQLPKRSILPCKLFLKDKMDPTGRYEKTKARLVGGGHRQDKSLYDDLAAPTVSTTHVFMHLAVAAAQRRHIASMDITAAYLNARLKREGHPVVHMRLNKAIVNMVLEVDPKFASNVHDDGTAVVEVTQALYGLVESALLWYNELSERLCELGYRKCVHDECVFVFNTGGHQSTIDVYVDDLLVSSTDSGEIARVYQYLSERYGSVRLNQGRVIPYLGMSCDFGTIGAVSITMPGYMDSLFEDFEVRKISSSPAASDLFEPPEGLPIEKDRQDMFHSRVARILYLAKRIAPECLLVCSVLSGRVGRATEGDWKRLVRLYEYLHGRRATPLVLRAIQPFRPVLYVDASYGVHADARSHTGSMLTLGDGAISVKSSKQTLVCKSSTEAELVAASDQASDLIEACLFLQEMIGVAQAGLLYQDNLSAISLIVKGSGACGRTKHVHIRYFWLKDRVERGELEVKYIPTQDMIADLLTKPLHGQEFAILRNKMLGIE